MSSFPDYDFCPFLESLGRNWYLEDELLRRILARFAPRAAEARGTSWWNSARARPESTASWQT